MTNPVTFRPHQRKKLSKPDFQDARRMKYPALSLVVNEKAVSFPIRAFRISTRCTSVTPGIEPAETARCQGARSPLKLDAGSLPVAPAAGHEARRMAFAVYLVAELRPPNILAAEPLMALMALGKLILGEPPGTRRAGVGAARTRPATINKSVQVAATGRFLTDIASVGVIATVEPLVILGAYMTAE
jgi:hypothetical protein